MKAHPQWRVIDYDLMHLLRSWFNRGFLRLERIDWRTSAIVLEKLIQYEAVHAIEGWRDLRRRLESDRRCFAFFHPQLPEEPIIFIEVALTRGMSAHVQPLLDLKSPVAVPANADCAMFYSITNCQEGLRGISFGNLLIKQVAEELKRSRRCRDSGAGSRAAASASFWGRSPIRPGTSAKSPRACRTS
jgi:malonyl-CoA decarboxylase